MKKVLLSLLGSFLVTSMSIADTFYPKNKEDLQKATVMITNKEGSSGGTGSILKSTAGSSYILTNKHICVVVKNGGLVQSYLGTHLIQAYKASRLHDLCVIKVTADLNISLKVADKASKVNDDVYISGHPYLMPTIITGGNISGAMTITMFAGTKKCTNKELRSNTLLCYLFGGMPILATYNTIVSSATIAPGNSGSAVFNDSGEIVGVAFAGVGRGISYGILVPHAYVKNFVTKEVKNLKWKKVSNTLRYVEHRVYADTKAAAFRTSGIKDLQTEIYFPAIYDSSLDEKYELYNCLLLKGEKCF